MKHTIINTISLSSGIAGDKHYIDRYNVGLKRMKIIFKTRRIMPTSNSLKGQKVLGNNLKLRADDFTSRLDRQNRFLISNIGGFDSHKLIPLIDIKELKYCNIKLLGFGDTTSFHLFLIQHYKKCYYGPSVLDGFAENVKMHKYTKEYLLKALSGKGYYIKSANSWTSEYLEWSNPKNINIKRKMNHEDIGFIFKYYIAEDNVPKDEFSENIKEANTVQGKLIGGCIDTIYSIKGLKFFPNISFWRDSIIFLETSEEEPNPDLFRKYLLKIKEEISVSSGVIFGKPKNETYFYEYFNIIKDIFRWYEKAICL